VPVTGMTGALKQHRAVTKVKEQRQVMADGKEPTGARQARTERLEDQLRANLKRRKEQARSRARGSVAQDGEAGNDEGERSAGPCEWRGANERQGE